MAAALRDINGQCVGAAGVPPNFLGAGRGVCWIAGVKLPLDLEDIVGVAFADVLKRAFGFVASLLGGSLMAAMAVGAIEMEPMSVLYAPWLLLVPVFTSWGIIYLPLVLGVGVYWIKSDAPGLTGLTVCAGLLMLVILLSFPELGTMRWAALGMGLGCVGAIGWLGWWWRQRQRVEAEVHLAAIGLENEARRQEIRERFGTDVADGDYAVPLENRIDPEQR